jgi:hypothetical protein
VKRNIETVGEPKPVRSGLRNEMFPDNNFFFSPEVCPFWACGPGQKGDLHEASLVFIGINPSSPIDPRYWDGTNFDYAAFSCERKLGKTRQRILHIVETVEKALGKRITFVNTNIYWKVSKRLNDLKNSGGPDLPLLLAGLPSDAILVNP